MFKYETSRIYISWHVKFDELMFPFRSTQGSTKFDFHAFKVRALARPLQIAVLQSIPSNSLPATANDVDYVHSSYPHVQQPQSAPCQEPPTNTVIQQN